MSIFFELYKQDDPAQRYTLALNRPSDNPSVQQAAFEGLLPVGTYVLAGVARTQRDGLGETVASALTQVEVLPNQTASADLTLRSTISKIVILGQPLRIPYPGSLQLTGQALDPDGKTVFVPSNYLKATVLSGQDAVEFDADGKLVAKRGGAQATVQLAEEGAAIVSEPATVTTVGEVNPGVIWVTTKQQQLGTINVLTGEYKSIGYHLDANASLQTMTDIAWKPDANPTLWGVSGTDLYSINPMDASVTKIGRIRENTTTVSGIVALDFRADGRLYGATASNRLYTIDIATANAVRIGTLPAGAGGDIAFDVNDRLFLSGEDNNLYLIDPNDATGTLLGSFKPYQFYGMAFTAGMLYGFSAVYSNGELSIVQLNTQNGTPTRVAAIPSEVYGLVNGASFGPR